MAFAFQGFFSRVRKTPRGLGYMTSLITNTAAMSALGVLRDIGSNLNGVQRDISSGLRVSEASDDVAYWSISTTMRSDTKAMTAVAEGVGLATGIVQTAYSAMETVRDSFVEIRDLAIMASQEPAPEFKNLIIGGFVADEYYATSSVARIERHMQQYQNQARAAMMSASFAGVNLLYHTKDDPVKASEKVHTFVVGYAQGEVQTLDIDAMDFLLLNDDVGSYPTTYPGQYNPEKSLFDSSDILPTAGSFVPAAVYWYNIPVSNPDTGEPEAYDVNPSYVLMNIENNIARHGGDRQLQYSHLVNYIDSKLGDLTDRMANLGSIQNALEARDEDNLKRIDTVTRGVSILVDADMEESSARLNALQTQQQLAVQALSIANQQPSAIMALFTA
ncbi:flagellin [Neorhizobium huautlense]|uniref:Flagellin n=1 Tax=Neorhizobium huautlense TaxID=67774 RepID=A0ABT9PTA2_9HYPH|nr:flagellin [Neorhizobium huautlense]MDP9837698.1 flagellin [Neorhizobium huautlense]